MKTLFIFRSQANGETLEMIAETLSQAKERIMTLRWGPYGDSVCPFPYQGNGLDLLETIRNPQRKAKPVVSYVMGHAPTKVQSNVTKPKSASSSKGD